MIVEMRTYTLLPGTTPQFEERFGAALPARAKLSPLAAFWHTEVGPLNQVIHVWPYEDLEQRTQVRAQHQDRWLAAQYRASSSTTRRARCSSRRRSRRSSSRASSAGIYEIRIYTLAAGRDPRADRPLEPARSTSGSSCRRSPSPAIPNSASSTCGATSGPTRTPTERFAVRDKARREGIWPPKGGHPATS